MYWMLLPLDANAARHLSTDTRPSSGEWAHWFRSSWTAIVQALRAPRD